ncbi:hypothetical protein PISMIDRAFT_117565 [Pisolithus microcarpus 441]|uniref:Uncharacterized protein n=1 Tax=Pisolithus microcarpus 441 TaxID=765257 RepID=A0A0C9Z289_9AGAM|nr:hypothetical protein PISMIDRAFT_117565 [Pisolithus microcarpus 441]
MLPCTVLKDIKSCIPVLYHDGYSIEHIYILGIKKSLVYKTLSFYARFGVVFNPLTYSCPISHHHVLDLADVSFIRSVIQHCSSIYLDEMQHKLWLKCHKYATLPTLAWTI